MAALHLVGEDRLWLEDTGGDGVPVVLLHPGITDATIWDGLAAVLPEHRVIRYDRPGFGGSPRATSPRSGSEELLAVLDALGVPRAHLVGNSLGGGSALAAAISRPDRVASLTLLCPAVPGYPWPEDLEDPDEAEYERLTESGDVEGLAALYLRVFAATGTDDYLRAQVLATTRAELHGDGDGPANPPVWDDAATVTVPVTVVVGDQDEPQTTLAAVDLAARLPDAVLLRLATDHLPQYRDPGAVAEAVLATVARADRAG